MAGRVLINTTAEERLSPRLFCTKKRTDSSLAGRSHEPPVARALAVAPHPASVGQTPPMTAARLATTFAALDSIPDVRSATAERRRNAAMANAASAASTPRRRSPPRQIPATARPQQPPVRQRGGEGLETLRALEHYLSDSVAGMPRGAPERLQAYRYVFTALIGQLPAHGPLLSEVKMEYDAAIESGSKVQPPQAGQRTLHPLQLPSAYYEREMRRAKGELARTRDEALALQRVLARTRARAAEARSRTQAAGLKAPPEGGARVEGGLGRVLGAAEACVAATDAALSLSLAGLKADEERRKQAAALEEVELGAGRPEASRAAAEAQEGWGIARQARLGRLEAEVEEELAEARRQLLLLELRMAGSGAQAQLALQGISAARGMLGTMSQEDAETTDMIRAALDTPGLAAATAAAPAAAVVALLRELMEKESKRSKALAVLSKMMRSHEASLKQAEALLGAAGWDSDEQTNALALLEQAEGEQAARAGGLALLEEAEHEHDHDHDG